MRVAYLTNSHPRVSQTFIRREILELERQGVEVSRFALRGWENDIVDPDDIIERDRTYYVLKNGALPVVVAVLYRLWFSPVRFLKALALTFRVGRRADRSLPLYLIYLSEACVIARWIEAKRIQHLHVHFGTNPATVAMLAGVLTDVTWSFTVHGPEEFDRPELISLAEKIRRCSFVIAISSFGRSQLYRLVEHGMWKKVELVRCGVGTEFVEAPLVPIGPSPHLVCVGRLAEQKGHLLLLEAARYLAREGLDFELVLAGDGELRQDIDRLIESYDLSNFVRVTGWLSSDDVAREIIKARALVLPSFAEGLPIVLMEAMALGRPVISTYVAGIPELVVTGEHGWLVPAGDLEALIDALRACILAEPSRLFAMSAATRKQVQVRHNIQVEAAKLKRLFSQVGPS